MKKKFYCVSLLYTDIGESDKEIQTLIWHGFSESKPFDTRKLVDGGGSYCIWFDTYEEAKEFTKKRKGELISYVEANQA